MSIKIRISDDIKDELNGRLLLFANYPGDNEEPMLFRRDGFGMGGGPVFGVTFYGLTGGAEDEELAGAVLDLAVDEDLEAVEIDFVVSSERCGHCHKGAFQFNHRRFLS